MTYIVRSGRAHGCGIYMRDLDTGVSTQASAMRFESVVDATYAAKSWTLTDEWRVVRLTRGGT